MHSIHLEGGRPVGAIQPETGNRLVCAPFDATTVASPADPIIGRRAGVVYWRATHAGNRESGQP